MDLKTIKNLLDLISESDVNEVEIEKGDFKIRIKKKPDSPAGTSTVYLPAGHGTGLPETPRSNPSSNLSEPVAVQPESREAAPSGDPAPEDRSIVVRSPIVGTFYQRPSPDSKAYVDVGSTVAKGEVLCIIEAMKIMNEIESEYSGKILKILADDSQPVEFDQPLFLIEPS